MNYDMRLEKARNQMRQQAVNCLILTPSNDLYYLTGYMGVVTERLTCLILTERDVYLVLPEFELGNIEEELRERIQCVGWKEGADPFDVVVSLFDIGKGTKRYAAIGAQMPGSILLELQQRLPGWNWVPSTAVMSSLRIIKDAEEIELLRNAQVKAGKALDRLFAHGIGGLTERQAAKFLLNFSQEEGLDVSEIGIVAAGPNGASPHHRTGDRLICAGDPVIIDFGGGEHGYLADMTRTPVVGHIPPGFAEVYNVVLQANLAAFEAIRPGVACGTIDRAGRAVIEAAGYKAYFTHRLGHGIGLEGHEPPFIIEGNELLLKPGYVFSDEPGIYLPGRFGIRIEDIVTVTEKGPRRLTETKHELTVID